MNAVSIDTFSWMVGAFIACCVTDLCLALKERDCAVVGGDGLPALFLVAKRLVGSSGGASGTGCTLLIGNTPPGVLFRVALLCILGIDFRTHFDVGLRAYMIGGASVMRGMIMMDVTSITLCSSSLILCSTSLTLCSVCGVAVEAGGVRMKLIFVCRISMSALPLDVVPATVVTSADSLVSALKCWCGVRLGT